MVIFGATGDLTKGKLMPALYRLYKEDLIGDNFKIIGFARRDYSDEQFREEMYRVVKENVRDFHESVWQRFQNILHYESGRFEDRRAYEALSARFTTYDKAAKIYFNKLFYLATPPKFYETIFDQLIVTGQTKGRNEASPWKRIIIEKPFGKDLETARELDKKLMENFDERQIYRIDHYLGKETVQNILAFRFANGIFEPIWNSLYIDHVQITMAESGGIGTRGAFYEGVGALRDVAQNHLLMMMALIAMEQPRRFSSQEVRDARANLVRQIEHIQEADIPFSTVRGQYGPSEVDHRGYREENAVNPTSLIETFAALRLFVNNDRWKGVPFYLRTGMRLKKDAVEISIVFRQMCHILFKEIGCPEEGNILTVRISPDEGVGIRVITKKPGHIFTLQNVDMNYNYKDAYDSEVVDAYERLLQDVFIGEQMLFNRSDELEASWDLITKILNGWEKLPQPEFPNYEAGTWGPKGAGELIERDGRKWILS